MKRQIPMMEILRETIVGTVRWDARDLSARQLAVLLICALDEPPHTVRGLATQLNVAKPAITRALDRLEEFDLVRRAADERDRRSVLAEVTPSGRKYVEALATMMEQSARRVAA